MRSPQLPIRHKRVASGMYTHILQNGHRYRIWARTFRYYLTTSLADVRTHHCSVLRKPFVSLARCILWAHLYAPGDEPQVDAKKIASQSDEATAELVAAQAIVQAILKHNNLTLDDIRPRDLTQLEWLSTLGEGEDWEDWRDPGTVRLGVPDMRSLFTSFQGL